MSADTVWAIQYQHRPRVPRSTVYWMRRHARQEAQRGGDVLSSDVWTGLAKARHEFATEAEAEQHLVRASLEGWLGADPSHVQVVAVPRNEWLHDLIIAAEQYPCQHTAGRERRKPPTVE